VEEVTLKFHTINYMSIRQQDKTQSDLFEQAQAADKRIKRKTRFLLPDIKNSITISYETMIFVIIGFLMVCITAFSLGVEKGRHDEKKRRIIMPLGQATREANLKIQTQSKPEPKKGVPNVATSKPKNIKSR